MTNTNGQGRAFVAAIVGAAVGAAWAHGAIEEQRKSRAERDDPDLAEEVCAIVGPILEAWRSEHDYDDEDGYVRDLAEFLADESDLEVELRPAGRDGYPDILVADVLVLEVKLAPTKTERDRLVGQCAGYSREWVTWAVLIDSTASEEGHLSRLLTDKGLDHIRIWRFA